MMALAGCSSTVPVTPAESVTSSTQVGAVLDAPTATRLDDAIGRAMMEASIPGAIVGIWGPAGDYVRTFGVADTAIHTPMQTDFYSRIGSLTKTFTVTAMLQLVDQGKLELDDPDLEIRCGRAVGRPDHPARAGRDAKRTGHLR